MILGGGVKWNATIKSSAQGQQGTLLTWDLWSLACGELSPPPSTAWCLLTRGVYSGHLNVWALIYDGVASIVLPKHLDNVLFI